MSPDLNFYMVWGLMWGEAALFAAAIDKGVALLEAGSLSPVLTFCMVCLVMRGAMALSAVLSDSSSGRMKQKPLLLSFVFYIVCVIMQGVMTVLSADHKCNCMNQNADLPFMRKASSGLM